MSRKIIGVTVGTQLPKPNFKQTDPTKGDYIKNKPDFDGLKSRVTDVEEALVEKQPIGDYALKSDIPTVHDWATATTKPTYTAPEVGADASGTASSVVSTHNTATDAHNDIRLLVEGLATRLNTLADSDDTTLDQMSEIVAYIKSNKSLIEDITTNKVNVSDIINNLTTNVANKPLSAAQGVALKALIDAIVIPSKLSDLADGTKHRLVTDAEKSAWNAKSDFSGNYNDLTNKPTIPTVPTNVSAFTNDKGYLTSYTETDPTVPSWAKSPSKPTYTASEVGASPANHASANTTYGIGTPDEYGHVKAAFAEKLLYWGDESEGQDPDLFYDQYGNLIGDYDEAEKYLEGIVPNMWFMTVFHNMVNLELEDTYTELNAISEVLSQLKSKTETQYSASNPPPYPVTSVNGQTGAVTINAGSSDAISTSGTLNTTSEVDTFFESGKLKFAVAESEAVPFNNDGVLISAGFDDRYAAQMWLDDGSAQAQMKLRNRNGGTAWNDWRTVLTDDNYSSYAAPTNHNQAASTITEGVFSGKVAAQGGNNNEDPNTYLLRNSAITSTVATPTTNGEICWVYE